VKKEGENGIGDEKGDNKDKCKYKTNNEREGVRKETWKKMCAQETGE
jgi:hypothetical protein